MLARAQAAGDADGRARVRGARGAPGRDLLRAAGGRRRGDARVDAGVRLRRGGRGAGARTCCASMALAQGAFAMLGHRDDGAHEHRARADWRRCSRWRAVVAVGGACALRVPGAAFGHEQLRALGAGRGGRRSPWRWSSAGCSCGGARGRSSRRRRRVRVGAALAACVALGFVTPRFGRLVTPVVAAAVVAAVYIGAPRRDARASGKPTWRCVRALARQARGRQPGRLTAGRRSAERRPPFRRRAGRASARAGAGTSGPCRPCAPPCSCCCPPPRAARSRYARSNVSIAASLAILNGTRDVDRRAAARTPPPGVDRRMAGPAFCSTTRCARRSCAARARCPASRGAPSPRAPAA